ncbi:restriction endonuclease subunit S [Fusibacter bizertensis]
MNENKKPVIRFSGFTDAWEQRKVKDVCEISTGKSNTQDRIEDGIYPFYVRSPIVERSNRYLYDEEAVLTVGDGVGTGKVYHYVNGKYDLHQRVYRMFDFKNGMLAKYFYHHFSNHFYDRVMAMTAKTSVDSVRYEMISEMSVEMPSEKEQAKIIGYLDNLDNLITLHQRKYDKLQNVKKSMLEKMFPKNGTNTPEIRFKGFNDAWEQRKLGDEVQITMGQSPDGSTYTDIPSDYILVQGNADLKNGWVMPRVWTSQVTKKAEAGDLIMSVRAPAGEMGKTAYNAIIGRGVAAIKGNEFIFQSLVKMNFEGYWKRLSCGSTFESLNSDNIKNAEIMIPHLNEQLQIGSFFENLDTLITLHQRELEKLQNIKKSCLERMFV